jgi:hypothetical protein
MRSQAPSRIARREALRLIAGAGGLLAAGAAIPQGREPFAGAAMLDDVHAYDGFGEHRTATAADNATSDWLERKLSGAGLTTALQSFPAPLFAPGTCQIEVGGASISAFPAWPVIATPDAGVSALIVQRTATNLAGNIALVELPFRGAASWAAPGFGDTVMAAARRGAAAVAVVTDGPTGGVIALNTVTGRFNWPVPVVIVGGGDGVRLSQAAASGAPTRLVSVGSLTPGATAANVIGRRPGRGKTLVVSTPTSGWFHCAGERGTGIAVFVALAQWLVRSSDADLLFLGLSGHELDGTGAAYFLRSGAPAPEAVRLWFHIGANAAMQDLAVQAGAVVARARPAPGRHVTVSPDFLAAASRAFSTEAGYADPTALGPGGAVGDLAVFQAAGYGALAGLLGANPLFHTRLDRAEVATTPADLAAVAGASRDFLQSFESGGRS